MAKWEKFADDLEDEEALTKAPEFQDMVADVVDPADATMPPEIRGCQVIERRHPGGQVEVFYCRPDGTTYFEAQATELIEAYRAAEGGGAPAAEMVIDTLGTGEDVPPQLRGARLVDRGGSFFFVMTDGEELPKEIGDSLFEAFESPEVTNPGLDLPAAEAVPVPVPVPVPPLQGQSASATEPQPTPEASDTVIDTLGEGQDVPPRLRGAKLVDRGGSFLFVTSDGEAMPKEIGDDLFDAWDAPGPGPGPRPGPGEEGGEAETGTQDEASEPAAQAATPSPLQKPFGYDDFGPVTTPEANVPDTIQVAQALALAAEVPAAEEPAAEPATEKLEAGSLEDQLKQAVITVRRKAATGSFDVEEATPTREQLESLVTELIAAKPTDDMVSRMVQRSTHLAEQISEAWADDESRGRQALHRDVVSGTLLVVAVNPTQLKDLDVLGLVTLLRLRSAEGTDRVVGELARSLRAKLVEDLARAIKASSFTEQVLQGARSTAGVVTDGHLWPEGVTHLVAQTIERQISQTVGEVLGSYREKGYAFPGLAEKVLEAYRHFATDIGERVAQAIE